MEIGSSCPYTDKCITFMMTGCDGVHHQGCERKKELEGNNEDTRKG